MKDRSRRRVRSISLATGIALAGLLAAARPALAQIVIAPDRSVVNIGQQRPVRTQGNFSVNPVVVPGNLTVRVGGSFSATLVTPGGFPGTGFVKPFDATDRARAANFRGSPNYNPNPVITGPWRKWW